MAQMPRGNPRSVVDPDADAYDEMIRRHKAMLATREGQGAGDGSTAAKIARTADTAGNVTAAAEIAPAAMTALSGAAEDLEAAKAVARFTGPMGRLLSAASQTTGFKADRARGMPLDEAFIKHAGGLALGAVGQAGGSYLGGLAGAPGGVGGVRAGAALGGYMGGKDGEFLAEDAANAWHDAKRTYRGFRDVFDRNMAAVNDPNSWIRPRDGFR